MRVYIIGSHSTGKSTVSRYISEKYKIPMITEVARMILSEKELQVDSLRTDMNIVNDYQTEIFKRQIIEENKLKDNFVSDRSFDCLAYAAQHSKIASKLFFSEELKTYIETLKQSDVFMFFIRPSKSILKQDGVRESLTWEGVIAIDAMVKFMIQIFNLRYFEINTDSMQERVQLVDSVLSLK
jgi:adenylate kinase family enzyme